MWSKGCHQLLPTSSRCNPVARTFSTSVRNLSTTWSKVPSKSGLARVNVISQRGFSNSSNACSRFGFGRYANAQSVNDFLTAPRGFCTKNNDGSENNFVENNPENSQNIENGNQSKDGTGETQNSKLKVVLDLDECMIHSNRKQHHNVTNYWHPGDSNFYVHFRPGVEDFLTWLHTTDFELSVYTAGTKPYATGVLELLDPQRKITKRLFREDCVPLVHRNEYIFSKDLSKITDDLARVVLVDNNVLSMILQPHNGLEVPDFTATQLDDDHLLKVKDTLLELDELEDVRPFLYEKCAVDKN